MLVKSLSTNIWQTWEHLTKLYLGHGLWMYAINTNPLWAFPWFRLWKQVTLSPNHLSKIHQFNPLHILSAPINHSIKQPTFNILMSNCLCCLWTRCNQPIYKELSTHWQSTLSSRLSNLSWEWGQGGVKPVMLTNLDATLRFYNR